MRRNFTIPFFYLGTFVTSFGSLLFVMCISALFLGVGYSTEIIGISIGIHRFAGIAANAWFGPKVDAFNSKSLVFVTEILGAVASMCLIAAWMGQSAVGIFPFCFLVGVRAFVVGVQSSSRSRLVKLLSRENRETEARFAIWLNKVTQGAHVISALIAIPLVARGNFISVILIDGLSFLMGGVTVVLLPNVDAGAKAQVRTGANIFASFIDLVRTHPRLFTLDQLLSLAVSGTILLMVKLSAGNSEKIIYYNLIFGSCIWLSSIIAHHTKLREHSLPYWILVFIGFTTLSYVHSDSARYVSYFVTYMGYWILFHKYTVEFQVETPKDRIGAAMATRGLAIAFTLSVGELLGGYLQNLISLDGELILRASVCLSAVLIITAFKLKKAPAP